MELNSPLQVVQAQLDAFNARDIDALMRAYAPDAEQFTLHGERLAKGHDEIRPRYIARFTEPDLHARLLSRIVMGAHRHRPRTHHPQFSGRGGDARDAVHLRSQRRAHQ
jgi:hypothetical protein